MLRYSHSTAELSPAEVLLAAIVRRAIKDAQQDRDPRRKTEALCWLWTHAPAVARMAELPAVPIKLDYR